MLVTEPTVMQSHSFSLGGGLIPQCFLRTAPFTGDWKYWSGGIGFGNILVICVYHMSVVSLNQYNATKGLSGWGFAPDSTGGAHGPSNRSEGGLLPLPRIPLPFLAMWASVFWPFNPRRPHIAFFGQIKHWFASIQFFLTVVKFLWRSDLISDMWCCVPACLPVSCRGLCGLHSADQYSSECTTPHSCW